MNDELSLKELERKTYNEFLIDGLTEILTGIVLLFLPVLFMNPIFVAFVPFFLFLSPQLFEFIRQRTTYPRIGRVEFKVEEESGEYSTKKAILELLILLLVVFILTLTFMIIFEGKILHIYLWYSWVPFIFGLIMFGPSLFLAEKTGLRYYYLFGIFSSVLGLWFSILDFPDIMDGMFLYFFTLGILILLLGVVRYILFVRNYPIIETAED
ncbi:MAG: hypothetical protein ACXAC6_14970 [Candidatus Hodarchaeales archaeon]